MQAGTKNRRITVQSPPEGKNADGDQNVEWTDVCTVWASHADLSGRELEAAQSKYSEVSAQFVIRFRRDITSRMRVVYDGKFYGVGAVLDRDGKRRDLQLLCSTGLNDG